MEWLRTPLVVEPDHQSIDHRAQPPVIAASTKTTAAAAGSRLLQLDLVRGLIMMIMAWDHSRDFISDGTLPVDQGLEYWSGPLATYDNNGGLFIQRWLPHFCAPGFFWLMGIGMAFFHSSRLKQFESGVWSNYRIIKHFAVRGVLLILMDRIVNIPWYIMQVSPSHWKSKPAVPGSAALVGLLAIFEVLTSLGLTMIICGLLLPVFAALSARIRSIRNDVLIITGGQIAAFVLGCLAFVISNVAIIHYQDGDPTQVFPWPRMAAEAQTFSDYLVRFTVLPGLYPQGVISYPILPWIGICLWGISTGYFFVSPLGRPLIGAFCLVQGSVFAALFILIRTFGGVVGNYRGWPRGEPGREQTFIISFLTVCKYPPSLAYALLTLSGVSFACLGFDRLVVHLQNESAQFEAKNHPTLLFGGREFTLQPQTPPNGLASLLAPTTAPTRTMTSIQQVNGATTADASSNSSIRSSNGVFDSSSTLTVRDRTPPPTGCCLPGSQFAEFPYWPWYGRWLCFPILTFGRVPLFFYVIHWYVLAVGSLIIHAVSDGLYLAYVPIWWCFLIVLMFLICVPYSKFKERQGGDSLWRFL